MVTHEQLADYLAMLVSKKLSSLFGEDMGLEYADDFNSQFRSNFEKNLNHMPDEISKFHGVSAILVISLYQILKPEQLTIDELKGIIMDIYNDLMKPTFDGMVAKLKESSAPFDSFVELTTSSPSPYENEYFHQETIQANENGYHIDIHRCLYFEIFKANGCPELGSILCEYDLLMASALETWVVFEREETIVSGFQRCTFRYNPR